MTTTVVGQIWKDNDRRVGERFVRILGFRGRGDQRRAVTERVVSSGVGWVPYYGYNRTSLILEERLLKGGSTGYTLVEDVCD